MASHNTVIFVGYARSTLAINLSAMQNSKINELRPWVWAVDARLCRGRRPVQAPPACLKWEYRLPLLLQEIFEANADIICLQELNHFGE